MNTPRVYTKDDLLLGGPGLRGYAYHAAMYCTDCGQEIIRSLPKDKFTDLETGDTEQVPVPAFFPESDTAQHCERCGKYLYGPKKHWIAGAGLHGCLFNYCAVLDSYDAAVDNLAEAHELGRTRKAALKGAGYLELNLKRDGNEYCEITECDCATPEVHQD